MSKASNQKGFTLIEMLLVLSIIMVISLFSYHSYQSYYHQKKLDNFMEQLEEDLLFTQMMAMSTQKVAYLTFFEDCYIIDYFDNGSRIASSRTRYYGEGIKVEFLTNSMNRTVFYLINGNVREFGKFRVKYKKLKYTVVFQLGRGRFYYE